MNVDDYINQVISLEGGYSDHPADRGGPTKFGITERTARAAGYTGDMRNLTRDAAVDIYKSQYWTRPGFGRVDAVSHNVAEELLDTGVNMGPTVAAKFLQRALNALTDANLTIDGKIGPATLGALRGFVSTRKRDGEKVLVKMLNAQQSVRYMEIAEADASQKAFMFGWQLNRA